jgi:lysozyme family protein
MAALTYGQKWPTYRDQWDAMKINADRTKAFESFARFAFKNSTIYQRIAAAFDMMPWSMIACIHWRESGGDFDTHLANGQPLNRETTIEPAGLGPFTGPDAFFNGAVAALKHEHFDKVIDIAVLEKVLFYLEAYNGRGYEFRNLPSAYLWGGTSIQRPGKFGGMVNGRFVDNHFDPDIMDGQLGCAGMLATMMHMDPALALRRERESLGRPEDPVKIGPRPIDNPEPPPAPKPVTPPAPAAPGSELQAMLDRQKEIADEVVKLQAESAELQVAIDIFRKWRKK